MTRISLATLQATGMAFFGLYGSTSALATTLALSAVVSCIGIGFQRGTIPAGSSSATTPAARRPSSTWARASRLRQAAC